MSRNIENIERELKAKAYIYNMLINIREDKIRQTKEENREIKLGHKAVFMTVGRCCPIF
jgi:hypothetical protein